ncbi:MAG: hypothetical protein GTO46_04990 [Gemmatimonadetes bacterium]|nr:hypothetical protein [Gemmatimonadota bacterium]NIO30842.1 hypothetical protein [Gemmatimonadota bacterium]
MPTIPTPFIGGADSPEQNRTDQTDLEPPFFSDEPAESPDKPEPGAGATEPAAEEAEPPFFFETETTSEEPLPTQEATPDTEPITVEEEVAPAAEPEPAFLSPTADEGAAAPQESDVDLPDYLFGADTPPPFTPAEGTAPPPLPESPERLAHKAEELLEGTFGDRIRDLVASLGAAAAEVAIPRAFAAGYMAAKSGEEK